MAHSDDAHPAFGSVPSAGERNHGECAPAILAAVKVLLNAERVEDFHSDAFAALQRVFAFDQALVLEERDGEMRCAAAWPAGPVGRCWPADPFLRSILDGEVTVADATHPAMDGQQPSPDLIVPGQSALCLPVAVGDQRAVLILLRVQASKGFGEDQVAAARLCAVVALTARNGGKREGQIQQLTQLVEQLQLSEQSAQKDSALLRQIIDELPISLTVQGDDGRFILVNAIAAANLATPADVLIGASPGDFLPEEDAVSRREWEKGLLQSGETHTAEEDVIEADGQHIWLTSHKPARICDQALLLTSSVEITQHKQVESQLAQRAHFDELTGLPNRILMNERFEQALHGRDRNAHFGLAFIDLDNFKHVNDYYSQAIGDVMLMKIAQRIAGRVRSTDTLARISGDEFLLLIDPIENDEQIREMIDAILRELKKPFHVDAFEVFTSASIGVSIYPEHGTNYEELRRNADSAMGRAKNEAKGSAIYFNAKMGQNLAARMRLEQRLRLAIRDCKFCCAFQPKVDIRSEEVVGFETLVRWRDENGEIQAPSSFIGLAIELGLIDPIPRFVLSEMLESMPRLDDAFGSDTTISLNIAAKQASDLDFMKAIAADLSDSPYAERIMLEVTEDAFFAKSRFQTHVLPILREIGVRVSIDDFGTGYSSLGALADITADEIKVDRSFITRIHERPRSQSVLRAIESLGHALGMTIIAEGIETFEELAFLLAATRIHYAQGFYFSRPFFLEDLEEPREVNQETRTPENARPRAEQRQYVAQRVAAGRQTRLD